MCSNCIHLKAVGCQLPKYWCEAKKQLIAKPEMTGCNDEEEEKSNVEED